MPAKSIKVHEVLNKLKERLEKETNGDRKLGARLRQVASECDALKPLADVVATLGNTMLTGGTLETL